MATVLINIYILFQGDGHQQKLHGFWPIPTWNRSDFVETFPLFWLKWCYSWNWLLPPHHSKLICPVVGRFVCFEHWVVCKWSTSIRSRGCGKSMSGLFDGHKIGTLHMLPTPTQFGTHIVGNYIISDYITIVVGHITLNQNFCCLNFISDRFQTVPNFETYRVGIVWSLSESCWHKLWNFRAMASCHLDLTLSHGSGEVIGLLHDPVRVWNIRDVPKAKLGRVQKAVDVFVLHSVLIQHVVWCPLFFLPVLPTATNCLDHPKASSQEVQRPPSDLLWPKTSSDKASSARSRAALILQQFVHLEKGWALASVKCAWWWDAVMHRPLVASVLRVVEGLLGPFCPLLSILARSLQCEKRTLYTPCQSWQGSPCNGRMWPRSVTLTSAICTKGTCNWKAVRQRNRRVWRRCYFRTEKAESSTVRLVPGGSCDGLQAVLVRDDDLDLTLSRPSSGFGTFQLEAVMFRNPNWFVYRKPLRSSFCTCLSLSMSCDVVCFFSARPPCGQPQTALTIRRLLWSQEVQRPPSDLLWPKTSSDKASSARSRAALILQQFVHLEKGWALASVKCAWWWDAVMHRPLVASVLRVVEGLLGPFCPLLSILARSLQCEKRTLYTPCQSWQGSPCNGRMWPRSVTLTSAICTKGTCNWKAVRQRNRRVWRRCYFRTEKAESSTVRLVPGGSCDGLQAVLVRDDDLDLTLSRPSSGFGTFQLEAVMFRNPNWFVYRKPLRSSFCTCLSLSMSCDVVCFKGSTVRSVLGCSCNGFFHTFGSFLKWRSP